MFKRKKCIYRRALVYSIKIFIYYEWTLATSSTTATTANTIIYCVYYTRTLELHSPFVLFQLYTLAE